MQAFKIVLIAACLSIVAGDRLLKQAPATGLNSTLAPAPGPGNCPAPKSPGPNCVTEATAFQTSCASYIQALTSATGGRLVATTDAEITQLVAGLNSKGTTPTPACCTATRSLLGDACVCDPAVQAVAQSQQNYSPSQFQTIGKVFLSACGLPSCTDTCVLPTSQAG